MAPAASAPGTQISAVTPDLFLSPDFVVVCAVMSVRWWASPRQVIDFAFVWCFLLTRAGVVTSKLLTHLGAKTGSLFISFIGFT